jgi:hypothetical protein
VEQYIYLINDVNQYTVSIESFSGSRFEFLLAGQPGNREILLVAHLASIIHNAHKKEFRTFEIRNRGSVTFKSASKAQASASFVITSPSPMASILSAVLRSESSDSIPDVSFIGKDSILTADVPPGPTEHKLKEMNGELAPEPLLLADKTRFVLFPIKQNDVSPFFMPFWRCSEHDHQLG